MTAQEYKNNQVNLLKGVIRLSPTGKKKLWKVRGWEQSRSMTSLNQQQPHVLSSAYLRSSEKLNLLQSLQPCVTPRSKG